MNLIVTAPSVSYVAVLSNNSEVFIANPSDLPDPSSIVAIKEPWVKVEVVTPKEYVGAIMKMTLDKRGINKSMQYLDPHRVLLTFEIPLASIVLDYFDNLKSLSSGYASMNYEYLEYRRGNLVKLDILIAGTIVEALSSILHKDEAFYFGSELVKKLKGLFRRRNLK